MKLGSLPITLRAIRCPRGWFVALRIGGGLARDGGIGRRNRLPHLELQSLRSDRTLGVMVDFPILVDTKGFCYCGAVAADVYRNMMLITVAADVVE